MPASVEVNVAGGRGERKVLADQRREFGTAKHHIPAGEQRIERVGTEFRCDCFQRLHGKQRDGCIHMGCLAEEPVTDDSLPGHYLRPRSIGGGDVGRTVPGAAEIGMTAGNEQVEDFDVVLVTHAFYANRTWTNGCYPLASRSRRFMVVFQLRMVMDLYSGEEMTALNRLRPSSALRRCE